MAARTKARSMAQSTDLGTQAGTVDMTVQGALFDVYKGTGPLAPEVVSAIVGQVREAYTGQVDAESQVSAADEALKALAKERREALARAGERSVTVARLAFLLTTKEVRGVASMTQAALATELGISKVKVNHYVTTGRALFATVGVAKEVRAQDVAAYKALDAARREGGSALRDAVALAKAEAKDGKVTGGAVRAAVGAVREDAAKAKATGPVEVNVSRLIGKYATMADALADGALVGTPEDLAILLSHVDRMRARLTTPKAHDVIAAKVDAPKA